MSTDAILHADRRPRLVVACLRVVDLAPAVDPLSAELHRDSCGARASASDLAALEHALRIAQAWSGRVLAVSAGPSAADAVLRDALALGAQVLRIPWQAAPSRHTDGADTHAGDAMLGDLQRYLIDLAQDPQPIARAIAAAIRTVGDPAVVLCGDRSTDRGVGALPALLAHEFNAAQALGIVRLELAEDHLIAERRLDCGRRERLRVPTPAVCSVEAAGVRLRRSDLNAAIASAGAPIPLATSAAPTGAGPLTLGSPRPRRPRARVLPAPAGGTRERLLALTGALTYHEPPTLVGPMDASAAADHLLAYLSRHGYLAG